MKKLIVSIGIIILFVSCQDRQVNDNPSKEKNEIIENEVKNLNATNNYLKSVKSSSTRSIEEETYPEYYGGIYISTERIPVFLVVKGRENTAKEDIFRRAKTDDFIIEECRYSYNDLNAVRIELRKKWTDPTFTSIRESLGWIGQFIDIRRNIVIVELEDPSSQNITRFKSEIVDSPLIEYMKGEIKQLGNPNKKSASSVSLRTNDLKPGGSIWVNTYGEGSMGYRVSN